MTENFHPFFRQPCQFMAGAASLESLPEFAHPEIAFIGRSNVGKSSLVNAILGRNSLVRTSQNPGATQQLNFFLLGDEENNARGNNEPNKGRVQIDRGLGSQGEAAQRTDKYVSTPSTQDNDARGNNEPVHLMFVDMPGYGYAKVSKEKKKAWDHLIRSYLCGRPNLKRTLLLIDARRGVMQIDDEFMDILDEAAVNYQVILTKTDTLSAADLQAMEAATSEAIRTHAAAYPHILVTSATTKAGIGELQQTLLPFAGRL